MEEAFKINQKNKKNRNDTAVQGTNDSAVLSKISMAQLGYFNDDFLKYFGIKAVRRSPIINRGYYIRAKTVDFVLQSFLNHNSSTKSQIMNLGAGFDSTYFRLKKQPNRLDQTLFIDIDFPDVINRKINLIKSNEVLFERCPDLTLLNTTNDNFIYRSAKGNYALIGIDMRDTQLLEAMLKLIDEFNESSPTMLLSEVVLTYMAVNSCNNLVKWIPETLQNCLMVVYEQILPDTAFGQVMCAHFKKLGSPLRCILRYPTPDSQITRYKEAGFADSRATRIIDFFKQRISAEEKARVDCIELFDEYEQWHLKCGHYSLILASKGAMGELMNKLIETPIALNDIPRQVKTNDVAVTEFPFKFGVRFGHTVCSNQAVDKLYVIGGFGESLSEIGRHRRLNTIEIIDLKESTVKFSKNTDSDRLFSTSCVLNNDKIFLVFGRSSPNKTYDSAYLTENASTMTMNDEIEFQSEIVNSNDPFMLRWRHSSCKLSNQRVVISGGKRYCAETNQIETLNDCLMFDGEKYTKILSDAFSRTRHSHSMCAWNDDHVIITGGLDHDEQIHSEILLLNTNTNEVKEILVTAGHVLPRYSHTSHVINDKLLLIGGINFHYQQPGLCIVDLKTLEAVELELPTNLSDGTPIMLHNHQSIVLNSDTILLVGGGGNCFSFGTHINKKPILLNIKNCFD